jgi:hypothetical protein
MSFTEKQHVKLQITLDRHNARPSLNYYFLTDHSHFSLPSTFKVNKYTMWVKTVEGVNIPVHYEMRGYNNLLGSHYDHYYVSYENFSDQVRFYNIL